ncbi:MAG TPA: hypothetical protein VGF28_13345 [Thermoanaerobaculia bacterium]|jgi:hypothetical protein
MPYVLDAAHAAGDVSSIEPIADELRKGKDDLAANTLIQAKNE